MIELNSEPAARSFDMRSFGVRAPIALGDDSVSSSRSAREDFASVLGIENRLTPRKDETAEDKARSVAEGLVAKVFVEPMLALVREANKQPAPFGPGKGEKQFGAIVDAQRSLEMVRSARWPIVERLTADLTNAASRHDTTQKTHPLAPQASPTAIPATPAVTDLVRRLDTSA